MSEGSTGWTDIIGLSKKHPKTAIAFALIIVGGPLVGIYLSKRPNVNTTQGAGSPVVTGNGNFVIPSNSNTGTQIIAPGASNLNINQAPTSVRLKYSARQTLQSELGDPNQIINLDNEATMRLWSCGQDSALFLLTRGGSISVKAPEKGKLYETGGGMSLGTGTNAGLVVQNMMVVKGPAKEIQFDLDHRDQKIPIGGRVFFVRLDHIADLSSAGLEKFEYTFQVIEQ